MLMQKGALEIIFLIFCFLNEKFDAPEAGQGLSVLEKGNELRFFCTVFIVSPCLYYSVIYLFLLLLEVYMPNFTSQFVSFFWVAFYTLYIPKTAIA